VLVLGQREARAAAAKQAREVLGEALADGLERLAEAAPTGAVDPRDRIAQRRERALEIALLIGEEPESLLLLLVLLDRAEIPLAERRELPAHLVELPPPLRRRRAREQRVRVGVARGVHRVLLFFAGRLGPCDRRSGRCECSGRIRG